MSTQHDDDMPDEIDFSEGSRGKFHRPGTALNLPAESADQAPPTPAPTDDPAFGMWCDCADMANGGGLHPAHSGAALQAQRLAQEDLKRTGV